MITAGLLILIVCFGQDKRLPVPDQESQKAADRDIRTVLKEEYSKARPSDRLALVNALLKLAEETKDEPAARYVLLGQARDISGEQGDLDTAFRAIDLLGQAFDVDPRGMKVSLMAAAAKQSRPPEDLKKLLDSFLVISEAALSSKEGVVASEAAGHAAAIGRRTKDSAAISKAERLIKDAADMKGKELAAQVAREKLASSPDDPAANLALGRYLCFDNEQWSEGLPYLAKGTDSGLKALAAKEQEKPSTAPGKLAVADAWWDAAEREKGSLREVMRRRAAYWYDEAAPGLTGLLQAKASQRAMQVGVPWMTQGLFGHWKLDEGKGDSITDSSPNRRHGKLAGATWATGRSGSALAFDGRTARVDIDAGVIQGSWTAAMWVFRKNAPTNTGRLMDSATSKGSSLRLEQSGSPRRVGITHYAVADHAFAYTAPAEVWVHLAWVGGSDGVSLYVNGKHSGSIKQAIPLSVDKLGSHGENSFSGSLDEIRVYSRALAPEEIDFLARAPQ